jgi:cyanophycin synthetase
MDVSGRRIMVLAAPGDRRDDDVRATARAAAAGRFDRYICRRDDNPRGRGHDEVPRLLAETLAGAGVPADHIEIVVSEADAIDRALGVAEKGDLVIVCADALERGWRQIEGFGSAARAARAAAELPGATPDADAHAVPRDPTPADDAAPPRPDTLPAVPAVPVAPALAALASTAPAPAAGAAGPVPEGMLRDARGVVLAPEASD